jgi:4,5-DOPA dioxygenase extradiol
MSDTTGTASDGAHGRMPALFIGHGSPMHALTDDAFTRALGRLVKDLPRPEAILVVSAHWQTRGTKVLAAEHPRTIHDFGGFPRELYEVQYPAPGAPGFAAQVCELAPEVAPAADWGLDHASWAVLRHMWPDADVPVLELSVDMSAPAETHWALGEKLAPLRDRGVLVAGSGNIVHSFDGVDWSENAKPRPWAEEFDAWVADVLLRRDLHALVRYKDAGAIADLSIPTRDHYLPLLYPAAMATAEDGITFPYEGIEMASMSMRCVRFG